MRVLSALAVSLPTAAFAHEGMHLHPHGIEFGWVITAALCGLGGYAVAHIKIRRRK